MFFLYEVKFAPFAPASCKERLPCGGSSPVRKSIVHSARFQSQPKTDNTYSVKDFGTGRFCEFLSRFKCCLGQAQTKLCLGRPRDCGFLTFEHVSSHRDLQKLLGCRKTVGKWVATGSWGYSPKRVRIGGFMLLWCERVQRGWRSCFPYSAKVIRGI